MKEHVVTFDEAVRAALRKYVVFSGRARRREYWWFTLFCVLVSVLSSLIDGVIFGTDGEDTGPVGVLTTVALFLPQLAVLVRRLHDTDRSAWWLLLLLVPIFGWIALFVFTVLDSGAANRYGPSPKNPFGGPPPPVGQYGHFGDPGRYAPPPPPAPGQYGPAAPPAPPAPPGRYGPPSDPAAP